MRKTRQDNYMTVRIASLYTEYETELSCPIQQGTVYDEEQIEQQRD